MPKLLYTWYLKKFTASVTSSGHSALRHEVSRICTILLIRSALEYSCSVWHPHKKSNKDKIEKVQRRTARFVSNNFRRKASVSEMLHDKCKTIHYGHGNQCIRYNIDETILNSTVKEKDLGVIMSSDLKPSAQCVAAANKGMSVLRQATRT